MKSAQRLAGLKVTGNFHVLRHTFCSHLAMRYMHLSPGHKEQATRFLDRRPEGSDEPARGGGVEAETT